MDYFLHVVILICIYSILSTSLDLLAGHAGLLSVSHAAFYGIGAYSSAIITVYTNGSFIEGLLVGLVISVIFSFFISVPTLRIHGDYFIIATIGFQIIVYNVFSNWTALTRGPLGITGIPQPEIGGWVVKSQIDYVILSLALAVTVFYVVNRITTSAYGRVLHAIREDEGFAETLGKNTIRFKITTFAVSSALAALAGSLYAHYITYISPSNFTILESILVISMVIIGGAGSRYGPIIGAVILVCFPEMLRFMGLPSSLSANLRRILYGSLLVLIMMKNPKGLVGEYKFGS